MAEPYKHMTEAEIVEDLVSKMNDATRKKLLQIRRREHMIQFHHGWGMHIRNNYRLWDTDNPHTKADAGPNDEGIIDDPLFPDQVSGRILQLLWDAVHGADG